MYPDTNRFKSKLLLLAKLLIGAGIFYFLFQSVFTEGLQTEHWFRDLWWAFRQGAAIPIGLAFGLVVLNWGLEAKKWQKLAYKVEHINFWQAFRAVLVGISLGFVTPNRLGDYAGRMLELRTRQRLQAFGAIFLGRLCQLFWTVAGGSLGALYFVSISPGTTSWFTFGLAISFLLLNSVFLFILFHPQVVIAALAEIPVLERFTGFISIISLYTKTEIAVLLGLSGLRYVVFVSQFALLLYAFGVQTSWWQMALGIAGTFLLKSMVPSFTAFTDLGMRELSAMYFFGLLGQNNLIVMSASLSLWFLNIALPSLLGLIFVWQLKSKNIFFEKLSAKTKLYKFRKIKEKS